MRELFDQLIAHGESALGQLVAEKMQETVDLEFKTKADPSDGELTKDDRRNLGIILSALSNSMGGLVVWGVKAKRNVDGVDCADELKPISNIERFKSEVLRALSQAIMPRHEGIVVGAITGSRPGVGYLAIFVERSERRPHRCEIGEKQYFKRVGDSSVAMEHYDIEDSFKRLVVPFLGVEFRITNAGSRGGPDGKFSIIGVGLVLINPSTVSARYPYLILNDRPHKILPSEGFASRREGARHFFSAGADTVIHPGLSLPVAGFTIEYRFSLLSNGTRAIEPDIVRNIEISYACGCLNSRQSTGTLAVTPKDLITGVADGQLVGSRQV